MNGQPDFSNPLDKSFATNIRLFQWQERMPLKGREPESPRYPLGALGVLADAAKAITDQVQAPAPVVAQSILATASLVAQPHVDVEIDGRVFPVSLFLITVAASGERKTSSDNIVLRPVKGYERKCLDDYKENSKDWSAELNALKAKKRNKASDHRAVMDHEDLKPPYPMMLTKEPTYEGLIRSLHEGLHSMGLFSDEAGRFIGGYALNDENMLKTAAGLSEIWDGSEITRTRGADKQTYTLHDRRLAMHLMLQPIVAYRILTNPLLLGQGFLPRCLVVQPRSRIGSRMYVEASTRDHPAVKAMSKRFSQLLCRESGVRLSLPLQPDAKAYWIELHDEFEVQAARDYEPIQAMACKAAEQVARIAGVLAFIDDPDVTAIPLSAVERASALMGFYLMEALRIQEIAEADQRIGLAEKLLQWSSRDRVSTQKNPDDPNIVQFHMQGLLQKGPNQLRTKTKAEQILKFLHEHGLARKLPATKFGDIERKEAWEVRGTSDAENNA